MTTLPALAPWTDVLEPWQGHALLARSPEVATGPSAERSARGRECARQALARLGARDTEVRRGEHGEPLWPQGWVGSISHSDDFSLAVVARASDADAIGVDVAPDQPDSRAFIERVCSERELAQIARLGRHPAELGRVVFSAKETVYKLQFPLTSRGSGLRDVEVLLSEDGSFAARFVGSQPPLPRDVVLSGRWLKAGGVLITVAHLPAGTVAAWTGQGEKTCGRRGEPDRSSARELA